MRRFLVGAVMLSGIMGTVATGATVVGAQEPPDPAIGLAPVQGAYWAPFAGLPDDLLSFGLVRTVTASGDADLADVAGVRGTPTSNLTKFTLAVGPLPGGIEPCWTVAFTDPSGNPANVSLEGSTDARGATATPLGGGWTQWTWNVALPPGTVNGISVGVDVTTHPPEPARVALDEVAINGERLNGPLNLLGLTS